MEKPDPGRRAFVKGLAGACALASFNPICGAAAPRANSPKPSLPGRSYNGFYFGWIPDLPTIKAPEQMFSIQMGGFKDRLAGGVGPDKIDLRPQMPPIYDQGEIGSCVPNSLAALIQYVQKKQSLPSFQPSRLYLYYFGRAYEGNVGSDAGIRIQDGVKVAMTKGVCSEIKWPYDYVKADSDGKFPTKANRAVVPPTGTISKLAGQNLVKRAHSLERQLDELKSCLALGFPFVFGLTIYPSFYDGSPQPNPPPRINIPLPDPSNEIPVAGHAVVAVGYDDSAKIVICRNSWGNVQDNGHFYLPYDYITNKDLTNSFWTITEVSGP